MNRPQSRSEASLFEAFLCRQYSLGLLLLFLQDLQDLQQVGIGFDCLPMQLHQQVSLLLLQRVFILLCHQADLVMT